jgi:hypothetical protein
VTIYKKIVKLQGWYNAAVAAGVPLCEYLQEQSSASMEGEETGAGRLVQSTSHGSLSVSYADDGGAADEASDLLAKAAVTCRSCTGTDQEKLDCLIATVPYDKTILVKSYTGLRSGCGC